MKALLGKICRVLGSRALPPLVIGFFFLVYIGLAFFTEDTLTALIALSSRSLFLAGLFALLPLSRVARIVIETREYLERRRALQGGAAARPELFDETVELPAASPLAGLERRLGAAGYRTRADEGAVSGVRGFSLYPARLCYLAATFCLFAGVLISLTGRASFRNTVIEGEIFPYSDGMHRVERIALAEGTGSILSKTLDMEVASAAGEDRQLFGLYPPSSYRGAYVYPRYLGVGLAVRFRAPDLAAPFEKNCVLNLYPPGKEASVEVPGSAYRMTYSLLAPPDGSDPYVTGKMSFAVKVQRGSDTVLTGTVPAGGSLEKDAARLELPDARRLVITDFIKDRGVFLIWVSFALFAAAVGLFLPVRLFLPRREMLFVRQGEAVAGFCRCEGRTRRHTGIFHEVLDLLGGGRAVQPFADDKVAQ